jgi:hypothetical protein
MVLISYGAARLIGYYAAGCWAAVEFLISFDIYNRRERRRGLQAFSDFILGGGLAGLAWWRSWQLFEAREELALWAAYFVAGLLGFALWWAVFTIAMFEPTAPDEYPHPRRPPVLLRWLVHLALMGLAGVEAYRAWA